MGRGINPRARRNDVVLQELEGELLIYDLKTNRAFCLNQTSALVWQACDGRRTIAEIGRFVGSQLSSSVGDDVVWLALDQLSQEDLIELPQIAESGFAGISRREAIKKAGLASMVALPIVASLIAPSAIHANSLCVPVTGGCSCPNGTIGVPCTPTVACADSNCVCYRRNNGGAGNGDCLP